MQVLKIYAPNEKFEILEGIAQLFGIEGIWEKEASIEVYSDHPGKLALLRDHLRDNAELEINNFELVEIPETNWNKLWESNFEPVVIAGVCSILAPFHTLETTTPETILISPEMAFGTGHHHTTAMMIELMHGLDLRGKRVLDVGTGTGILAIYADKKGADKIFGIDIEENAIRNCIKNKALNKSNKCTFRVATLSDLPASTFDVILANINRNVIAHHQADFSRYATENGRLLTSGYLGRDRVKIEEALKPDWTAVDTMQKGDWVAQVYKKESKL